MKLEKAIATFVNWVLSNQHLGIKATIGCSLLIALTWFYLKRVNRIADLKEKGLSDLKNLVMVRWNNLYFLKYNKSLTESDFKNHLEFFNQKFSSYFVDVKEVKWLKFFLLQPIMIVKAESFPKLVKVAQSPNAWVIRFALDAFKNPLPIHLDEISEIFISGKPGSGKSYLARFLVKILRYCGHEVYVATPKPFDYADESVVDTSTAIGIHDLSQVLKNLLNEIDRRKTLLIEAKKTHVKELALKAHVVFIDEAHLILKQEKEKNEQITEIIKTTSRLIRLGRAYGIIMVLITQKAQQSELDVPLREGIIISGKLDTRAISLELFGDESIATSERLKSGVMVVKDAHTTKIVKVAS